MLQFEEQQGAGSAATVALDAAAARNRDDAAALRRVNIADKRVINGQARVHPWRQVREAAS